MDDKIWAAMQQHVYQTNIRNVDELRQRLLNVCSRMKQDVIDASIDQCRVRLKARVRSGGGHFEHMLLIYLHKSYEQADNILDRHLLKLNVTAPY